MFRRILLFYVAVLLAREAYSRKPDVRKSKLCGNVECTELLFKANVVRPMQVAGAGFINDLKLGEEIAVMAIKYSDRIDLMYGMNSEGNVGTFYKSALDKSAYADFLKSAVDTKKTMQVVSQEPNTRPDQRLIGTLQADVDLVRDHYVSAKEIALELGQPPPPEPTTPPPAAGHGHSHGAHGHSHGGHGHSHEGAADDAHGHSHGANGHSHEEPAKVVNEPVKQAPPVAQEKPVSKPPPKPQVVTQLPPLDKAVAQPPPVVQNPPEPKVVVQETPQMKQAQVPPVPEATVQPIVKELPSQQANEAALDPNQPVTQPPPQPTALPVAGLNEETKPEGGKELVEDLDAEIARMLAEDLALLNAKQKKVETPVDMGDSKAPAENSGTISETTVNAVPDTPTPVATEEPKADLPMWSTGDLLGGSANPVPVVTPQPQQVVTPQPQQADPVPTVAMDSTTVAPQVNEPVVPTPTEALPVETVTQTPMVLSTEEVITTPQPIVEESAPESNVENVTPLSVVEQGLPPLAAEVPVVDAPVETSTEAPPDPEQWVAETGFCDSRYEDCSRFTAGVDPLEVVKREAAEKEKAEQAAAEAEKDKLAPGPFEDNWNNDKNKDIMDSLSQNPAPAVSGGIIGSIINIFRSTLQLDDVSDAGVGLVMNGLFVLTAILIHLLSSLLSESGDSVVFERQVTHDLATKCKTLTEQLKQKEADMHRLSHAAGTNARDAERISQLEMETGPLRLECQQLRSRLSASEAEAQRERSERETIENTYKAEKEKLDQLLSESRDSRLECDAAQKQLEETRKELSANKNALERFENDLREERRKTEELHSKNIEAKSSMKKLHEDLQASRLELREMETRVRELEMELSTATAMLEEQEKNKKDTDATESGGSGGWSDFGDEPDEEEKEKEKKVPVPGVDLKEVVKLRAQLKKIESDFEHTKSSLDAELSNKKTSEEKISSLEHQLSRKVTEVEQRDQERRDADERCSKMLAMMDDLNRKINDQELTNNKLRDDVVKYQADYSALVEEKRKKEDRVKDLESEVKTLRNEVLRMEHKHFHEVMELKKKLDVALMQQFLPPPSGGFDMQKQSGATSDREGGRESAGRGMGVSFDNLWDDPTPRSQMNISRNRTMSPDEEDYLSGNMPQVKKLSRGRRSDRMPEPSDFEKRKDKKEAMPSAGHRRRSRSHGRQAFGAGGGMSGMDMGNPMHHPFMPADTSYPPFYDPNAYGEPLPLNRRHSKSGHVYYSSGGSNGGRSPPPEMPRDIPMPPPGASRPRSKRPGMDGN